MGRLGGLGERWAADSLPFASVVLPAEQFTKRLRGTLEKLPGVGLGLVGGDRAEFVAQGDEFFPARCDGAKFGFAEASVSHGGV